MCILCTPRPIYRSTYRPTLDRCIGRHIDRVSGDMSVDISVNTLPICRLRYVGRLIDRRISAEWWSTYRPTISRYLGRCIGRYVDHWLSAEYRPTVGGVYVSPGQKLRLSVTDVYKTVASTPQKRLEQKFIFWNIGQKTWNLLKSLCCPLLVWNFSQPIAELS